MVTRRRLLRGALAAIVLGGAVIGLVLGLMIVLPTPNLGLLWPNLALDLLAVVVEGYSLWLAVFAVLGLALALLARRIGLRRTSLVAAVLGVVTVALSLVPVVQGWRTASQEGVALSLSEYFSFPSGGPSARDRDLRPAGGGGAQAGRLAPAGPRRHRGGVISRIRTWTLGRTSMRLRLPAASGSASCISSAGPGPRGKP